MGWSALCGSTATFLLTFQPYFSENTSKGAGGFGVRPTAIRKSVLDSHTSPLPTSPVPTGEGWGGGLQLVERLCNSRRVCPYVTEIFMSDVILSHFQAKPLLAAMACGERLLRISLDLGLTTTEIALTEQAALLPTGPIHTEALQEITEAEVNCFVVAGGTTKKIQFYSTEMARHYSLMPTESAPTMLISGLPMHRIKNTNPHKDTLAKIRAAAPRGRVLDTATGLGYTAIEAAKTASDVVTIELDPVAQQVCRLNPWSRALFDNPKIEQKIGDSFDVIETLERESFARIIHDPPMFSLAGHLYSGEFYAQMFRVLKPGGRAFHYIGDPESKSGSRTTRGVVERLKQAGFARVESAAGAFGVVAFKS